MSLNRPSGPEPWDTPRVAPGAPRVDGDGDATVAIAEQIVQVYVEAYGRGPTRAQAYIQPQFAVCILRDVLTGTERSLLADGGDAELQAARGRINEAFDRRFMSIVEMETGRPVLSHLARVRPSVDIAVHFFLLGDVPVQGDALHR